MALAVKENINDLLSKDVNRREFLMHVGAAAIAVIGVKELMKNLTDPHQSRTQKTTQGYGMSAYGK